MTNSIPVEAYCCTPRGAAGGVALLGVSVTVGSIYALAVGSSAIPIIGIVIGVALAIFGTYLLYQDYKERKLEEEKRGGIEALKILTQPIDVQEENSNGAPTRIPINMSFAAMHQLAAPSEPKKIDPPETQEREELLTVINPSSQQVTVCASETQIELSEAVRASGVNSRTIDPRGSIRMAKSQLTDCHLLRARVNKAKPEALPQPLKKVRSLPPKDEDDQIEQEPKITPIVLKPENPFDEYSYLKVAGSVALLVITVAAGCYLLV